MHKSNVVTIYPTPLSYKLGTRMRKIEPKVSLAELERELIKKKQSLISWVSALEPNFYIAEMKGKLLINKAYRQSYNFPEEERLEESQKLKVNESIKADNGVSDKFILIKRKDRLS